MNQPQRVDWVDTVKGVAILLVVLRHVTGGLRTAGIIESVRTLHLLDAWVYYDFSVAAFFFVGGLFILRSVQQKTWQHFVMDRIRTLAYPYFLWSLLNYGVAFILEDYTNQASLGVGSEIMYRLLVDPGNRFWFLYSFFIVLISFATLIKLNLKPIHFLFISIGLFILNMIVEFDHYNGVLYDTSLNIIFFALAVIYSQPILKYLDDAGNRRLGVLGVLFIGLWAGMVLVYSGSETLVIEFIGQLTGLIGLVCLSELLIRIPPSIFLYRLGQYSIEIYLTHGFALVAVRVALSHFLGIESVWVHVVAGMVLGVGLPLIFAWLVEYFRIPYIFTFPKPKRVKVADAPAIPHRYKEDASTSPSH